MKLDGRVAVITGAGRGIGKALALRLAAAGASVAVLDLHADLIADLGRELGDGHLALTCDVADEATLGEVLGAVRRTLGDVDLFFANAGVAAGGDLLGATDADWDRAFAVNVRAHVIAARNLLPGWLERGEGYFVSVASAAGLLTQLGSAPYATSKHAAVAFAEWLSVTYGDRGVRVTCVCPMGVQTAMLEPGKDGALDAAGAQIVRDAGALLEPDAVAETILDGVDRETFLVLPHPEVLTYFQRKGTNYERWLSGMRRLQAGIGPRGRPDLKPHNTLTRPTSRTNELGE